MTSAVRLAALLTLLCCAPAQAAEPFEPYIVGGGPASRSYPYAALLRVNFATGQSARCGGSLIAARYIVTAAHCVNVDGTAPVSVDYALGNVDASAAPYSTITEQPIVHPRFSGQAGGGYDAAILHLPQPVGNDQLQLLRPGETALWQPGTTATVIGWGLTEDPSQGGRQSNQLLEVQVPVFSDADCSNDFTGAGAQSGFFDATTEVCAGGKDGKDSCNGDSGGGLLVPVADRFALAGIVSFGAVIKGTGNSCAENLPGVYTRVAADPMNSWIRSIVPQAEIDVSPAEPEPDQAVTLTSASSPDYDTLEWDLDGDGGFGDATGSSVTRAYPAGPRTIALRATRSATGDREVRRITLHPRFRSPVAFTAGAITVTEGDVVTLGVTKAGRGAGGAAVVVSPGSAALLSDVGSPSPLSLQLGSDATAATVTIPTVEDSRHELTETFTVDLRSLSGDLTPGSPGRVTVTVLDDDVTAAIASKTRTAKVRRGRVRVRYSMTTAGTAVIVLQNRSGSRDLGRARQRRTKAGTYSVTVRLNAAGRRALKARRKVRARLVLTIFDGQDLLASKASRLTLRR